jgi:hypothetical protein
MRTSRFKPTLETSADPRLRKVTADMSAVRHLQRTLGNRTVGRLVEANGIQRSFLDCFGFFSAKDEDEAPPQQRQVQEEQQPDDPNAFDDYEWSTNNKANCYAYAANCKHPLGKPGEKAHAGAFRWQDKRKEQLEEAKKQQTETLNSMSWGAEQDGMLTLAQMSQREGWTEPPSSYGLHNIPRAAEGFSLCCLLTMNDLGHGDHWLRREDSGEWRHKNQGDAPVQNYVVVGKRKVVLTDSTLGTALTESGEYNKYTKNVTFMYAPKDGIQVASSDYKE